MAFDIYKGWPFDGALTDNVRPKDLEGIVAGMIVKKDHNGELVKADGTANEVEFMAIDDQTAYDVRFAGKMPVMVKNAIVLTDQFVTTDHYDFGSPLQAANAADIGKLKLHLGGAAPLFGTADGIIIRDSVSYLKVIMSH